MFEETEKTSPPGRILLIRWDSWVEPAGSDASGTGTAGAAGAGAAGAGAGAGGLK